MLSLTRTVGESILIGDNIRVIISDIRGSKRVVVGIEAPLDVLILRGELEARDKRKEHHDVS